MLNPFERSSWALIIVVGLLLVLLSSEAVLAVRVHDFKRCHDSSFCRRLRRLSSYAASTTDFESPYTFQKPTFDASSATLTAGIRSALYPEIDFQLQFIFHQDGTARAKMDQVGETYKGWKRYDEAAKWAYERRPILAKPGSVIVTEDGDTTRVR